MFSELLHILAGILQDPGNQAALREFGWVPFALAPLAMVIAIGMYAIWQVCQGAVLSAGKELNGRMRWIRRMAGALGAGFVLAGYLMCMPPLEWIVNAHGPLNWMRFAGVFVGIGAAGAWMVRMVWRPVVKFHPERRQFLEGVGSALMAAPFAAGGWGFLVERSQFRGVEVKMPVRGLPKEFDGFRIAQLSDIHIGPFLSRRDLAYCVDMANAYRSHLAVITGDLVTSEKDPLEDAITELRRLKASAGVLGCMGNHEIYAGTLDATERLGRSAGIRFLRGGSYRIRSEGASINVAGVDYQRKSRPYLVGAERLLAPGLVNILLSHNPDVFPVAAEKGFAVTLAGHTHGGQVSVEILDAPVNVARFMTPYVYGLYEQNASSVFVTRGIGTVGVPVRLGAPPEVALIELCAI